VRVEPRTEKTRDIFGQEIEVWDLGLRPLVSTRIGQVLPGQVAQQAGIRGGDRVLSVDGVPVGEWDRLAKIIHGSPGKPLTLTIRAGREARDVQVIPRATSSKARPGRGDRSDRIGPAPESQYRRLNPSPPPGPASRRPWTCRPRVTGFVKLVQAKISPSTIGGPILIAQMAAR